MELGGGDVVRPCLPVPNDIATPGYLIVIASFFYSQIIALALDINYRIALSSLERTLTINAIGGFPQKSKQSNSEGGSRKNIPAANHHQFLFNTPLDYVVWLKSSAQ